MFLHFNGQVLELQKQFESRTRMGQFREVRVLHVLLQEDNGAVLLKQKSQERLTRSTNLVPAGARKEVQRRAEWWAPMQCQKCKNDSAWPGLGSGHLPCVQKEIPTEKCLVQDRKWLSAETAVLVSARTKDEPWQNCGTIDGQYRCTSYHNCASWFSQIRDLPQSKLRRNDKQFRVLIVSHICFWQCRHSFMCPGFCFWLDWAQSKWFTTPLLSRTSCLMLSRFAHSGQVRRRFWS